MNTQTHVLLAVAVVGSVSTALINCKPKNGVSTPNRYEAFQNPAVVTAIIFGALLPDLSLFIMFGYAKLAGIPESVIWSEMYYSSFWQSAGATTNSIPIYLATALIAYIWMNAGKNNNPSEKPKSDAIHQGSVYKDHYSLAHLLLVAALASLLHALTDLPLHHDDGHPHFWPFTHWIYSSPVSYWDSNHHADIWWPIECVLGLVLIVSLWRKTKRWWSKAALLVAAISYVVIPLYFSGILS